MISEIKTYPLVKRKTSWSSEEIPENILSIGTLAKWNQGYTGNGIVIAVMDTGCETHHPDLRERIVGVYNFSDEHSRNISIVEDLNGHGTHVAGIISGSRNDSGLVGIAPKSSLLILKTLDRYGRGTAKALIEAINYAVDWEGLMGERVRVISLSLGMKDSNSELLRAIKRAIDNNISVVAASGNNGDGNPFTNEYRYPSAYDEVISVGALQAFNQLATFSNTNEYVDIYAPGSAIYSTFIEGGYTILSGTSMAAPHVSGTLALLIEEYEVRYGKSITQRYAYELLMYHTKQIQIEEGLEISVLTLNKEEDETNREVQIMGERPNRDLLMKCFCETRRSQAFFTKCLDETLPDQDKEFLQDIIIDLATTSKKIQEFCKNDEISK